MSRKHIMVDLETLSSADNALVVSIGAIEFDPNTGDLGKQFYTVVKPGDQQHLGRDVDANTVMWWLGQSDDARRALYDPKHKPLGPGQALLQFHDFWKGVGKKSYFWSHATFDSVVLGNLYKAYMLKPPWHYRDVVDIRTMVMLSPKELDTYEARVGLTHHNALDDAIYQAGYISKIWQHLKGEPSECQKTGS